MKFKVYSLLVVVGLSFVNLQASEEIEYQSVASTAEVELSVAQVLPMTSSEMKRQEIYAAIAAARSPEDIKLEHYLRTKDERELEQARQTIEQSERSYARNKAARDLRIDELTRYVRQLSHPSANKDANIAILRFEIEGMPGYYFGLKESKFDYQLYCINGSLPEDMQKMRKDINPRIPALADQILCLPLILFCCSEDYDYFCCKPEPTHEVIQGYMATVQGRVQAKINELNVQNQQEIQELRLNGIIINNQQELNNYSLSILTDSQN